jgi:2-polyprenyl-3-methyl-5-hydroxy-6-metoxy-1,4-benzoquinol methylase
MFHPRNVGTDGSYVPVNTRPYGGHEKLLGQVDRAGRVLDVGCSTGYLSRRLVERGATVVGIELDERAAVQARQWCEDVLTGDVETMELPFEPASFDVVMCADLIEHLRDPCAFLERVRPLIKAGGRLVLTTPNVANWTIRLALLFGSFRYTQRGILDRTHTHLFTRKTLIECLEGAGYRVEELDFTVPVPGIGSPRVEAVAHAVGSLRPSLLAFQFVVAASPVR